jgi:magnesium transporter
MADPEEESRDTVVLNPERARDELEETAGLELPTRFRKGRPGERSGIDIEDLARMPSSAEPVRITCIDYSPEQVESREIKDVEGFIIHHRPGWSAVRWINVDGLTDSGLIRALAIKYDLHPLAIEDMLKTTQRPKFDVYGSGTDPSPRLFIVVRMLQLAEEQLQSEQISMFLGRHTLLTFQESPGDIWGPIRERLQNPSSRLRQNDVSFLAYALIDAIVDYCFPVLEHYGDRLEELEERVLENPERETIKSVYQLKRELLLLRRVVWPMREVVHGLQRDPHPCLSDTTRTFLRDVSDHIVQIIDIIETYREVATSLTESYMTSMSNRLNEVIKVLTIIGTIFIPLTFLAGVYGMNMPIPENQWKWTYPAFWIVSLAVAGGMLAWFRRRRWI